MFMAEEKKVRPKSDTGSDSGSETKKQIPEKFSTSGGSTEGGKDLKDLVEKISDLSVLELAELVKILEEKFGVTAQMPMMPAGAGVAAGEEVKPAEEKTSFNVELTEVGPNKIAVIRALRSVIEIGLKDAKDFVDAAPKMIKEGVSKEEAEEIKKKIEEAGAKVTLK